MDIKINNKKHRVPELVFEHFTKMEEQGFSVTEAFEKKQYMLIAMGFVCVITGLDREEAEELITQHVYGGGNLIDIVNTFSEAAGESDFFRKMLNIQQTEETRKVSMEEKVPAEKETK